MSPRKPPQPIEITCPTGGLIAGLYRPRGAARPKLCDCPPLQRVAKPAGRRVCMSCPTVLNRYNPGPEGGPCTRARAAGRPRA